MPKDHTDQEKVVTPNLLQDLLKTNLEVAYLFLSFILRMMLDICFCIAVLVLAVAKEHTHAKLRNLFNENLHTLTLPAKYMFMSELLQVIQRQLRQFCPRVKLRFAWLAETVRDVDRNRHVTSSQ